ncbi:MAG TPA: phenylalanine--tRNA ligase beta subunit-related protein [Blastocatellia bacterium]|nr:phenylalanine--tRNA ligase beta subunit-related protein [Blastocatellia bacterium]
MDPTRYRPASEALIRRCLDKDIFRINPLVDTNNLLSIRLQIPLGIYDIDRIEQSEWTYRVGREGESYLTISNQEKSASGKLVIADLEGVIGSPVADSGRAAIGSESKNILVIAYLPFDTGNEEAEGHLDLIESTFTNYIPSSGGFCQLLNL